MLLFDMKNSFTGQIGRKFKLIEFFEVDKVKKIEEYSIRRDNVSSND